MRFVNYVVLRRFWKKTVKQVLYWIKIKFHR